jgi:hypothetical protein
MKKFTILAGLMTLALFIGVAGTSLRAGTAEARPTDVISFSPGVCVFLTSGLDWEAVDLDGDTVIEAGEDNVVAPADMNGDGEIDAADNALYVCAISAAPGSGLVNPDNLAFLAAALDGAVDNADTYADLVDATAAQLGEDDDFGQVLWVLTMVTNDDPLHLDADEGLWYSTGFTSSQSLAGDCPTGDNDCDDDGVKGDGVVVDLLDGYGVADLGDAIVTATQSGIDVEMDYTVVGMPDDLTLAATKTTIQEGSADEDCDLGNFTGAIAKAQITGLLATVSDEDGTALTSISVAWDTSDDDVVNFAQVQEDAAPEGAASDIGDIIASTVSIAASGQISAPNLGCAGDTGEATINAAVSADDSIDDEIDITVVGAPASMTLAANPLSITCNGTNSSEVSATLLDSAGKPVVAGNKVRFEVVALGIANPIIASTDANGVAKTTITPLSGVTAGVTVLVSVVDNADIEQNILVACQPAVPIVVPPVTPTSPTVTPPRTGDGGYLP